MSTLETASGIFRKALILTLVVLLAAPALPVGFLPLLVWLVLWAGWFDWQAWWRGLQTEMDIRKLRRQLNGR